MERKVLIISIAAFVFSMSMPYSYATSYSQYGNTIYGSNGTTYTQYGNKTYSSNESSCTQYGNTTYCD